jgi:hypothetical protein
VHLRCDRMCLRRSVPACVPRHAGAGGEETRKPLKSVQLVWFFWGGVPHPSFLRVRVFTRHDVRFFSISANRINSNFPFSASSVIRPATPRPVLRIFHQLSLHRICVHVLQLFLQFLLAPHIEIIESSLPTMRPFIATSLEWKRQLPIRDSPALLQQRPRNLLFQHLQNLRGFFLPASLISKCTCSGITTYPINRNSCRRRTSSSIFAKQSRLRAVPSSGLLR